MIGRIVNINHSENVSYGISHSYVRQLAPRGQSAPRWPRPVMTSSHLLVDRRPAQGQLIWSSLPAGKRRRERRSALEVPAPGPAWAAPRLPKRNRCADRHARAISIIGFWPAPHCAAGTGQWTEQAFFPAKTLGNWDQWPFRPSPMPSSRK